MAESILSNIPDEVRLRLQYEILRERMMQASAIANALRHQLDSETHEFWLAHTLDGMMGSTQGWSALDSHFDVQGVSHV